MMPWLAVIIRPTINRGYLPRPVAMDMLHRCGPLQRVGTPRVLRSHLAKPHGGKEIPQESNLPQPGNDCRPGDEYVYRHPFFHEWEFGKGVIPTWHAIDSHEVHGEKHKICAYERETEMEITQLLIHHTPKHLGIPMVNTA